MILADTSIWIDHFRRADPVLHRLSHADRIFMHPIVTGEVLLGLRAHRPATLELLQELPRAVVAEHEEVLQMIEDWQLYGSGIGYGDAQLLASVLLTPGLRLWTRDTSLRKVAQQLSLAADLA